MAIVLCITMAISAASVFTRIVVAIENLGQLGFPRMTQTIQDIMVIELF